MKTKAETYRINYKKYGETINIKPIADIHYGSKHCDMKALKEYLGTPSPDTHLIGLGDFMDCIIVSDSKRYRKSGDGIESDDIIGESVDRLVEIFMPFKSRIIGFGLGNHEDNIIKRCSVNPMKMLCDRLGVPYLGYSFLIRLIISQGGNRSRTIIIRGHHGWGGGSRTQGANLTKFSRDTNYFDADVFLYGHVHNLQYDTIPRLALMGDTLIAKPKHMVICGTFLKTYSDSTDSTYSECAGYPPTRLGGAVISMRPINSGVEVKVAV